MNLGPETETVEHKKSTSELKEGVASIASMLNKHGRGELFFGVTNDGDVIGQQVSDSTLRNISQAIGSSIDPRIFPSIEALDDGEGRSYVRVAFSGGDRPYACKGSYRIRVADEDVLMTGAEVRRMASEAFLAEHPWDSQPSPRPISDVDEKTLRAFVDRGIEAKRISEPYAGVRQTLASLGLLAGDSLTNAADVLFCQSARTGLKMGILQDHGRTEILDLHQERGTVFDLIDKGETYVLNNTRRRLVIDGAGPRREVPELPAAAIREALVNAFVHRDWARGACVQVDIFYDSVEILSPGWFIEGQSPEAHLEGGDTSSDTRNRLIADTVFRSGDMEAYGTGIARIKSLCDEAGVRVEYARVPSGTKLVFHRNDAFAGEGGAIAQEHGGSKVLSSSATRVLDTLAQRPGHTAASLADELGMSARQAQRALKELRDGGCIEREGSDKSGTWVILRHPLS